MQNKAQRRGVLYCLALLVASPASADVTFRESVREQYRDESYLLIEDQDGSRLFLFSVGSVTSVTKQRLPGNLTESLSEALEMTRSADARRRVRGLTLLSGADDPAALDAALVSLADPVAAVREEAVQLIVEHPDADIDSIVAIASRDPSQRVREASVELLSDREDDEGD